MPRWFHLTLAYDGTRYGGWQIQPNATTIQEKLEVALQDIEGSRVKTVGSGRTDAGVHSEGQVVSFSLENWRAEAHCLVPALNRRLPEDIVVRASVDACQRFHSIRHAISKKYRYTIRNARVGDPIRRKMHWHIGRPLDIDAMRQATLRLLGEKDFAGFQSLGSPRKSTVRNVLKLDIATVPSLDGIDIHLEIEANGFLYNMVRNIAGSLIEVGVGKREPDWILSLLEGRDRSKAGQTAPARGLCLVDVQYPDWCFDPTYRAPGLNRVEDGPVLEYNSGEANESLDITVQDSFDGEE